MAKTGHPNFVIDYQCTWRGIQKNWSITSNHSGATLSLDQALVFVQAVDVIIKGFMSAEATDVFVSRYAYYNGQDSAPLLEADYESKTDSLSAGWAPDSDKGVAYTGLTTGVCGAEVCAVLLAPVGESSTNKPIFLRHWVHNVPPSATDGDTLPLATGAGALAAQLGDGSLPGNRVLISATGKQGSWGVSSSFGAHKMSRRWSKRLTVQSAYDYLHKSNLIEPIAAD